MGCGIIVECPLDNKSAATSPISQVMPIQALVLFTTKSISLKNAKFRDISQMLCLFNAVVQLFCQHLQCIYISVREVPVFIPVGLFTGLANWFRK